MGLRFSLHLHQGSFSVRLSWPSLYTVLVFSPFMLSNSPLFLSCGRRDPLSESRLDSTICWRRRWVQSTGLNEWGY